MADPPLLALRGARLGFGGAPLFADVDLQLFRGDRACLVGRNGSGKSTLLRLLAGELELDAGERFVQPGLSVSLLPQDPLVDAETTVAAHVAAGRQPRHEVDSMLAATGLDGGRRLGALSGGERRRADLARALAGAPDLLLLDEPTNHLDLAAIDWLERTLAAFPGAVLTVSHDRTFLANLTRRMLWLDRGKLRQEAKGFAAFEDWSRAVLEAEEKEAARLDVRLAAETRWLLRGITARRRRNQGRLRKLEQLRAARAAVLRDRGRVKFQATDGEIKSRLAIEAEGLRKSFTGPDGAEKVIVEGFSTRVLRGDRIGIIGPNGSGKTTLLRLLTGELTPDSGRLRLAKSLTPAYFDQNRAALDPDATLWDTLCPQGGDSVMVQGRQRHVVGYLKDFLFRPDQVKSPVGSLSGGERNRLLLARLLAMPGDLLVLDEPTNDLDMDTLDLLQELLADHPGTLLLVSHDRDFLDRTVSSTIAMEGDGLAREYPGGYRDYLAQRGAPARPRAKTGSRPAKDKAETRPAPRPRTRLGYKQQRELEQLPDRIARLEAEVAALEARLADPALYRRDRAGFDAATDRLAAARAELAAAEERWLALEEAREALARGTGS